LRGWFGPLTADGRRFVRRAAARVAKKLYLWLETESVTIFSSAYTGQGSHPLSTDPYERWLAAHPPRPVAADERAALAELKYRPTLSVLMPVYNPRPEFLRAALQSVVDQAYPDWQLCIADDASIDSEVRQLIAEFSEREPRITVVYRDRNGHISAAGNSALALARGEFCALLDHDDLLAPDALYQVVRALNRRPDLDLLHSDEDKVDEAGRFSEPHFKPQWSPDTLLTGKYVCHLLTVRTELLREIGGFREGLEGAQDFDLVLRIAERTGRVLHIPRVLYHWRKHAQSTAQSIEAKPYAVAAGVRAVADALTRRNEPGIVEPQCDAPGSYSVRYELREPGRVGIVIPTRDRADLLEPCLRSVFEKTQYQNFAVHVVDNGSREERTFELFRACAARYGDRFAVRRDDGAFNFSRLINLGVRAVGGPYVLLLNNDVEVIESEWLQAMLEQAQRPSIGCVGARLLFPDGTVQHSGVVLGRGDLPTHVFHAADGDAAGRGNRLRTVANYSAVTGACLLVRRDVFDLVGGLDERFAVDFNDIDFCLRVREAGFQNILVPQAELVHHESVSRGDPCANPESRLRHEREIALFRERWPNYMADDPCLSPHLAPHTGDLRIVA
jgi:GT2 family glycosyltransferase